MKNRATTSTRMFGVIMCLAPVLAVAVVSRSDGFYLSVDAPTHQKSRLIKDVATPNASPVTSDEAVIGSANLIRLNNPSDTLSLGKEGINLVELEWMQRFLNGGSKINSQIDCSVPENLSKRFKVLKDRITAQGAGEPELFFSLARILRKARGADCQRLAFEYFQKSAEQGYARAYPELANAYRKGLGIGANFDKALINFEKAARLGFANSAYRLIEMTERGSDDVAGNALRASEYLDEFLPLIESKIRAGDAVAARSLARLYNNSNLVQLDPEKSLRFMEHAVKLGDRIAMHDLAFLLLQHRRNGLVKEDIYPLLLESAELGYSAAYTAIGRLHLKGELGFLRTEAPTWLRSGVDAGHPGAMAELATLYIKGELVARDMGIAKDLALQGARLNHLGSKRILAEILELEKREPKRG